MTATKSTMAAVKAALRDALQARPLLATDNVQITYGEPAATARKETIRLGEVELGNQDPVALRSGKRKRRESYIIHVYVEVLSQRTPEASEVRAVELSAEVEDTLALDSTIGGVTNLLWAIVEGMEMDTDETPDGPRTVIDISVRCVADLI